MTSFADPVLAAGGEPVQTLMDAGVAAAEPFYVSESDDRDQSLAAILTVPNGYTTKTIDLEELRAPYRAGPIRKAGFYTVRDVNSFLAYYIKHAEQDAEIWVTPGDVTAVLNANTGAASPAGNEAHWEDHRLTLKLMHSAEWCRWIERSGRLLSQDTFAEFLEEAVADVVQPDMATILEIVQSLEATTKVEFESAFRTQDGQRGFKYKETTTARAGQKGELEIPSCFVLALRVYEGQDPINVTARFRYRLNGDELRLGIVIDRIPEILEAALASTVTTITEGIDRGMVLIGPAPGNRARR